MANRLTIDQWPIEIMEAAIRNGRIIDVIWRAEELDDPSDPFCPPTYCVHSKFGDDCQVDFTRIIDGEPFVPGPDVDIPDEVYNLFSLASHSSHMEEVKLTFRFDDA